MAPDDGLTVSYMAKEEKNPYIELLHSALEEEGVNVNPGLHPVLFKLTRTILNHPSEILHLDWLSGYYMSDGHTGHKPVDDLITFGRAFQFILDLLIASQLQTAIVWTVHNKRHHERKYPRIERVINEIAFWVADGITVKCKNAVEDLNSIYLFSSPDKFHIVQDGNYISAYENQISKQEARDKLGISEDEFVYLFFGMIREYKGVPHLIRSFSNLEYDNVELWIVGQPKSEQIEHEIRNLAEEKTNIHTVFNYVEDSMIQSYMNASDTLVLPYQDILNSGSVHLGASFGVPIVAPEMGCIPASLPQENTFIYNPKSPDGLLSELENVYDHPELGSIGEANYKYAESRSWENSAKELVNVYESLCDVS